MRSRQRESHGAEFLGELMDRSIATCPESASSARRRKVSVKCAPRPVEAEIVDQPVVLLEVGRQADLPEHRPPPGRQEPPGEFVLAPMRGSERPLAIVVEQEEHRLGEARQIPVCDRRLVPVRVAPP